MDSWAKPRGKVYYVMSWAKPRGKVYYNMSCIALNPARNWFF